MAVFNEEGAFAGKKIGVVGTSSDQAEMNLVVPALHKAKADVIQTAVNGVPDADTAAFNQEYDTIALKFQSSGVNDGRGGRARREQLGGGAPGQPEHLPPEIVATDYIDSMPMCPTRPGTANDHEGAVTAGGYPPVAAVWDDPAMKTASRPSRLPSRQRPSTTR